MGIPKEKQMHPAVTEEGVAAPQRVGHKPRAWLLCTFFTSNTRLARPSGLRGSPSETDGRAGQHKSSQRLRWARHASEGAAGFWKTPS